MDELVAKVAAQASVDPVKARKAVIIMMQFLLNAGPREKVEKVIADIPGAREAIGNGGGGPQDVMGTFNALTAAGLGMGEIQGVATTFGRVARQYAGAQPIDEIVAAIPGLGQFL